MKTIQIKLDDQEYDHILKLSGQSTGIKALKEIVISYQQDQQALAEYQQRHIEQQQKISEYQKDIAQIVNAFETLKKYGSPF